jgi:MFS transporter, DHA3 family, tetracycline resistance protein
MVPKARAYPLYLLLSFGTALFFTMWSMVTAIYRVENAGLNPLQLVLVGTVLEASVFLFEVPTGIVADLRSRRLSIVIGYALIGLGFVVEALWPLFGTILLAQVIWGVGYTFTSGAQEAWLADELGEEGLTHVYLRGSQAGMAGTLLGLLFSTLLGSIAVTLPMLVGGALTVVLALLLALFMPETGFKPTPAAERDNWQKMIDTFRQGLQVVSGRQLLILIMAIAVVTGFFSEGLDRLWAAHLLENFTFPTFDGLGTVAWFGLINVVEIVLVMGATELIRRRGRTEDRQALIRLLFLANLGMIISLVFFGLAGSFGLALTSIWSVMVFRRSAGPLYAAWLNEELPGEVRATVLSMRGQLDAIGQVVGGPLVGALATATSLRVAMVVVAAMLTPILWLYRRAWRWYRLQASDPLAAESGPGIAE